MSVCGCGSTLCALQKRRRSSLCKACYNIQHSARRKAKNVAAGKDRHRNIVELGVTRRCTRCRLVLAVDRFSLHPNAPDGRQSRCHDCCSARLKGYWPGNYQKNKAKKLAVAKKWREEHPEACRSGKRRRYAESPWAVKAEQHARRAMKMGNGGDGVSPEDWRLIVDEYSGRCAYCLAIMGSVSMDHVIPLVRGGEHSTGNVVPACRSCNSSKHDHGMIDLLMRPHLLVTQRMLAASQ